MTGLSSLAKFAGKKVLWNIYDASIALQTGYLLQVIIKGFRWYFSGFFITDPKHF